MRDAIGDIKLYVGAFFLFTLILTPFFELISLVYELGEFGDYVFALPFAIVFAYVFTKNDGSVRKLGMLLLSVYGIGIALAVGLYAIYYLSTIVFDVTELLETLATIEYVSFVIAGILLLITYALSYTLVYGKPHYTN